MSRKSLAPGFHPVRRERLLQEEAPDAYKLRSKLAEPSVCPQCGAVFRAGRWIWDDIPKEAHHDTCPACHRVNDNYPAGYVNLGGAFFASHRDQNKNLVRHEEQRERSAHPLKRIMAFEEQSDALLVTTTDVHLARGIGEAVHQAYHGELEFHTQARRKPAARKLGALTQAGRARAIIDEVIGSDQRHPAKYWHVLDEPFGHRRIPVSMQAHA